MKPAQKAGLILLLTFVYAVLRYNVFGGVAWAQVPVYIVNKSVSWAGLLLLGMSLLAREKDVRRYFGTRAVAALFGHLLLSIMILNPAYFAKFYGADGRMTLAAEFSMFAGAVGFLFLASLFYLNGVEKPSTAASLRAGWGRAVLWCGAVHVAAMGYTGWLTPEAWHGYLPPISLLSFLAALFVLYRRHRNGRQSANRNQGGHVR